MITEDNKWDYIDAFLAGKLDPEARALVLQKQETDPEFRTEILLKKALLQRLSEQTMEARRETVRQSLQRNQSLIDDLIEQTKAGAASVSANKPQPAKPQILWSYSRIAAAALLTLGIGLGVLGYFYLTAKPETLSLKIRYEQRNLGFGSVDSSAVTISQMPVVFSVTDEKQQTYASGADGIRLYVYRIPANAAAWKLSDDPETGNLLLRTPEGDAYLLDGDTYGVKKPLIKR